jgi:subtilase family serine protease
VPLTKLETLVSPPASQRPGFFTNYMKGLLNPAARKSPVRFFGGAFSRRQLASLTLGASASLLFAPCGAFALSNASIVVSPMIAKSTLLSPMEPAKEVIIQFTLPLSDREGARDLLKHVSTPKDQLYRHYITLQEFVARFGANAADYATVRAWAVANGLSIVHEATARTSLTLRGTVAQIQTLFKTQLNYYKAPSGDEFYSASVAPTVPSELVSKIEALIGLTGGVQQRASQYVIGKNLGENPKTAPDRRNTAGGTGPGGSYSASDLRTAYVIPKFGGVSAQTVAVFEDSSIAASDYEKYLSRNKLPKIKLSQIPVDQQTVGKPNGDQVEAVLDVDMISAINPDVKEVQVYVAPAIVGPTLQEEESQFSTDLIDVFQAVGEAFSATGQPQTLSVSYGLDEILMNSGGDINGEADALNALGLVGVTVLVSAGDHGAYGDTGLDNNPVTLNVMDPGSQPFVTCVGGTTLFTYAQQQYLGEEVWNDLGIGDGATGGGVSNLWGNPYEIFNYPWYQDPQMVTYNGGDANARNVPDVAAVGDPLTGVGIYVKAAGGWLQIGGTSVSAPIWAGYLSILNSGAQYLLGANPTTPEIGFFNPLLYYVGDYYGYNPDSSFPGNTPLYPVLDGSNGNYNLYGVAGYSAGYYYNNCCGLGSLWGPFSFQALTLAGGAGTPPPSPTVTVKPSTTSAKITWTPSTGATGYAVYVQLYEYNTNSQEYQGTYVGQTAITKKTSVDVTGLLANQIVQGTSDTLLYGYAVTVAAVDSSGVSVSNTVDFFTKK